MLPKRTEVGNCKNYLLRCRAALSEIMFHGLFLLAAVEIIDPSNVVRKSSP